MCKAFSCVIDVSKKVTWKFGVDSHSELQTMAGFKDQTADVALMEFARVEITPKNNSYLLPDEWVLKVDESIRPQWFGIKHEEACHAAHKKWTAKLYKILIQKKIVHPFEIVPPEITKKHILLLKQWASVRDSVGASVWASVRDSVGASVWASVRAYTGSFFIIPTWKYIKHPRGKYPFTPAVKLWEAGLVPSFDGTSWRLHGGKKAAELLKISAEELKKYK